MVENARLPMPPLWREEMVAGEELAPLLKVRWRRCLPLVALLLSFVGALGGVYSWVNTSEQTRLVPGWMTEFHTHRWPSLAAAAQDHLRIVEAGFFHGSDLLNPAFGQRNALQHQLSQLTSFRRSESVLIYISCYAGIDERGEVYCLPSNSNPDWESDRYPLREILQAARDCPSRRKLLVLDIAWPSPDPRLGVTNSLVIPGARALVEQINDPHLQVLTSAADGQMALVSEELGQSVFGYYMIQGLRGQADGWNARGVREGRVSVRELAAFVQFHVSRWARMNRESEQTPLFLGAGEDFELVAMASVVGDAWPDEPPKIAYPNWLYQAWRLRDQWAAARYRELYPRVFEQWESALRRAEKQWCFAADQQALRTELSNVQQQLAGQIKKQQLRIPRPPLHSIALLRATGVRPDPVATAALRNLLTSLATKMASLPPDKAAAMREQLIAKFETATQMSTPAGLAMVICDQLRQTSSPTADDIRLLDRLMRAKQPEPFYAETLLLRNLAELAENAAPGDWHSATAHQAVLTGLAAEEVTVRALTFPWVRGLLDAAWQRDHDAKVLLWSRGYASWSDADTELREAHQLLQVVQAYEDALTDAQRALGEACRILPEYFGGRSRDQQSPTVWFAAAKFCAQLSAELTPPTTPQERDEAAMRSKITDIRRQVMSLVDLYAPIHAETINQSLAECADVNAGPAVYTQSRRLLDLPGLNASERKEIWETSHQLSLRLLQRVMQADKVVAPSTPPMQSVRDAIVPSQFDRAVYDELLGFREALEMLRICGLSDPTLEPTITESQQALDGFAISSGRARERDRVLFASLAEKVRKLWFVSLPEEIAATSDVARQARLARLFPPFAANPTLDDPTRNPQLRIRVAMHRERWAWLAERYQYAARDVLGPRFYAEAARDYTAVAGPMPSPVYLSLASIDSPVNLSFASPTAVVGLTWSWNGSLGVPRAAPADAIPGNFASNAQAGGVTKGSMAHASVGSSSSAGSMSVRCFSPSAFLNVTPAVTSLPNLPPLEIQLALSPGALPTDLADVQGFLLQVGVEGRNYHLPVALPTLGESQKCELLIGVLPTAPAQSLELLQLRPIQGTHSFYLFARNLTAAPRDARVELYAADQLIAQAEVKLAGEQTAPVVFAGTPPAAHADLPEISPPLVLRAVDATDGSVLAERSLPCDMLSPREYLEVTSVVFDPSSLSENCLDVGVRALSLEGGPPVSVRLSVSSDQIPGLVGIQGGAFVGSLPKPRSELLLEAKNMLFTPSARKPGRFFVDVDDYPRAFVFKTIFPRQGDPIFPIEDSAPRLQLLAPGMGLAGPGYPVTLPTDNAPVGSTLELAIGHYSGRNFQSELTRKLPTARHERLGFSPHGPQGQLLAQASMRDWELRLDTTGIVGQRQLRARLLDVDGREMLSVQQTIVLDDTPPEQVSFISPPTKGAVKAALELRAMGFDSLSGISQVMFFVGKPVQGKLPEGASSVEANPLDQSGAIWSGKLELPAAAGRIDVSVQFTNGVGQSTFATIPVEALDPAALDVGNIAGTVVEGPRPQANLDVELLDAQGKPAKMARTKANGDFLFEGVAAGDYTVYVLKPSSQRKGQAAVKVEPGSSVQANISLAL